MPHLKEGIKFLLFILIIAGVTMAIYYHSPEGLSPSAVRAFVDQFGSASTIIFILITAIATAISVPLTVFTFVGAVLFGIWKGTFVNVIGALLGSILGFFLAKTLGRRFVQNISSERLAPIQSEIKDKGLTIIFLWRIAPMFPFSLVNYAAGLSQITFKDYFTATVLGQIPNTFILTYLCATIGERLLSGNLVLSDFTSVPVVGAIIIFIAFIIIPIMYHAKMHKKKKEINRR